MNPQNQKLNWNRLAKKVFVAGFVAVSLAGLAQEDGKTDKKPNRREQTGERKSAEQRSQDMLERMTKELNLDAKQKEQIKPILEERITKLQGMRPEKIKDGEPRKKLSKEERKDMMEKMKAEKDATDAKLKAILTPEQYAKMKAREEAMRDKMRERMREHRENGGMEE